MEPVKAAWVGTRMTRNETIYGEGILAAEIWELGNYLVVTDETPWRLYEERFPRPPTHVLTPDTLEQSKLDKIISAIPQGTRIVGLGGGLVIDAAKYFAYLLGETPLLVPTITSSNAPFSDFISIRRGGNPFGFKKDSLPKRIIVDYDLIQMADPRLNRAGYGDVLCLQTTLNDWRIMAAADTTKSVDPAVEEHITRLVQSAMDNAKEIGSVSQLGIETLMRLLEESTELIMSNPSKPISAGGEHLFAWNLEHVTGRHFAHGEIVALGIVICSHLQAVCRDELRGALDSARVGYHPEWLEIEWSEIEETLLTVGDYNRKMRKFNTIFDEVDWTPESLSEVREAIYPRGQELP